jgi:hypothetical protein
MTAITAIVFLTTVCNYSAPLSMSLVQSIYFNQLQSTLATCTKNNIIMDVPSKHKFVDLTIPCVFPASYDSKRTIDINNYNISTSTEYAYELMLYAVSKFNVSKYGYQMMILPQIPIIYFPGLGTVGHSFTWYVGADAFSQRVFAHEFGHNLGFGHSGRNGQEYGDESCVMGSGEWYMCYAAPHRYGAGFDTPQKTFSEMPKGDVIIDKTEYIIINKTLFVEAKDKGVYTYYLAEGNRTCSICTLLEEGQSCVIHALNSSIAIVSMDDRKVILGFSSNKNTTNINSSNDLCQQTDVITSSMIVKVPPVNKKKNNGFYLSPSIITLCLTVILMFFVTV